MKPPTMTRAQQTRLLVRLREIQATLARVNHRREAHDEDYRRTPAYLIGYCASAIAGLVCELEQLEREAVR